MRGAQIIRNVFDIEDQIDTLDFKKLEQPGRDGIEFFPLYDTSDTGPDGPAAAIVRYLPGATVSRHLHPGYELIVVLDGALVNDSGRHEKGALEVCPPGSSHALASPEGCTVLVIWEKPVKPVAALLSGAAAE